MMNQSQHRIACLEIHFAQFLAPLDEECRAYIKMELRESICPLRLCCHWSALSTTFRFRRRKIPTRYVSHIRMVFLTLISRMRRQFIHRKANCMNSTPSVCKWVERGALGGQKNHKVNIRSNDISLMCSQHAPSIRPTRSCILFTLR